MSNANGPVVLDVNGETTLVVADTSASVIYAYPYDGATGTVGERGVFMDTEPLGGIHVTSPHAGRLIRVVGTGFRGRPEPRVRL